MWLSLSIRRDRWRMATGSLGAYVGERATDDQAAALGAIFGGGEGGPMAAFASCLDD